MALPPHGPHPRHTPTARASRTEPPAPRPRPTRPRPPPPCRRRPPRGRRGARSAGGRPAARPAPYGDRLHHRGQGEWAARAHGGAVAGYDRRTGALRWRYARVGHRPLAVLPARGEVIALWDDGLLTDTDGRSVRWHRALPDAAEWLPPPRAAPASCAPSAAASWR
ncbi:hypothetical protein LT493_40215 [Streptomyces tricolor]|nr:hypothetical protein [Streptomyces tricolor]